MEKNAKNESKFSSIIKKIRKTTGAIRTRITSTIDRWPLGSFFGFLALVLIVIAVGNALRKPAQVTEEAKKSPKNVEIFSIGKAPRINFSGKVEKTGAIKIVSQSPGVVQMINVLEGGKVYRGQTLLGLSSNYQGGNISSLTRQIAEKSVKNTEESYPEQISLIVRQKEIAEQSDTNSDTLRSITTASIQATQDLISLNQEIVNSLDNQIKTLESMGGNNDVAILQLKQGKAGATSGLMSLKTALASSQYQSTPGNPPEKLSDLGKDIAIGQLNLQEKSLNLAKEIAGLNLRVAQISESFMYPASPCSGVLERVSVNIGDVVNPGQVIATIACDKNSANVIVFVSGDVAKQVSRIEKSTLMVGTKAIEIAPRYVSSEPTDGNLHSVIFTLPDDVGEQLTDNTSISVDMPIGNAQATASVPYVPIDAVFQTQSAAIIYTASQSGEGKWIANGKDITLGQVFGSYVEVQKGLSSSDQVILNRNVISGDEVTFQ